MEADDPLKKKEEETGAPGNNPGPCWEAAPADPRLTLLTWFPVRIFPSLPLTQRCLRFWSFHRPSVHLQAQSSLYSADVINQFHMYVQQEYELLNKKAW